MDLKDDLIERLEKIADNPQNEIDRIILKNKDIIKHMTESQLADVYTLRRRGERLCRLIPYKREEIALLSESGEVSVKSKVAELENCFAAV